MAKDSSPFHQTKFFPIGNIYTEDGVLFGLRKPDGDIIINFDQRTSFSTLKQIARLTDTEIVQVRGTWTFLPHKSITVNDKDFEEEETGEDSNEC